MLEKDRSGVSLSETRCCENLQTVCAMCSFAGSLWGRVADAGVGVPVTDAFAASPITTLFWFAPAINQDCRRGIEDTMLPVW